jgi:hypothetical protein
MSDVVEPEAPQGIKFEEVESDPLQELEILVEGLDDIPKDEEVEDEEFKGKTKSELAEEIRRQRADLQQQQERSVETSALREVVEELKSVKQQPVQQQQIAPQGPQESEEEFKARVNQSFYDDPYGTLMEFQSKKLAPEVQRLMSNNVRLSRKLVALDPDRADTFRQYSAEVDDYVAQLPPQSKLYDPDVYEKAHDAVIARHVNEIIERKVQEHLSGSSQGNGRAVPPPPHTEAGRSGAAPPPKQKTRIVLSAKEREYIARQGIGKEEYAAFALRHPDRRIK